jgi:hypothetical protein
MFTNKEILKNDLTPENVGSIFHDILMGHSLDTLNFKSKSDEVMKFWGRLREFLDAQPYFNLRYCLDILNTVPVKSRMGLYHYEVVIITFLSQRFGPNKGINNYIKYTLGASLGIPSFICDDIPKWAAIRMDLIPPTMSPEKLIYDLNWLKLSLPWKQFLANQQAITSFHGTEIDQLVLARRRITIFNFFLKREYVYVSDDFKKSERDKQALENMSRYLESLKKLDFDVDFTSTIEPTKKGVIVSTK